MRKNATVLLVVMLAACDGDKAVGSTPSSSAIASAALTATVSTQKTGIRECDAYFEAVNRCLDKVAEDKRKAMAASANTMRANLRGVGGGQQFYMSGCKDALDAVARDEECR